MHFKALESKKVSPWIDYDNGNDPVKGPKANLKTRQIYLQETYLEHLWSFIYSIFVIYEEGIQEPST
jgi:hypothetical protein